MVKPVAVPAVYDPLPVQSCKTVPPTQFPSLPTTIFICPSWDPEKVSREDGLRALPITVSERPRFETVGELAQTTERLSEVLRSSELKVVFGSERVLILLFSSCAEK